MLILSCFIDFIKSKIIKSKPVHNQSLANPDILWDRLKCFVTGHCIEYTSRKKAERNKIKSDLQAKIDNVRKGIADFDENIDLNLHLDWLINFSVLKVS